MTEAREVLRCPMGHNDARAATVGDYLIALLHALWNEGEGFSGKRPFGNSGWEYEIYTALVKAGLVDGTLDEDGYVEQIDDAAADRAVFEAINHLAAQGEKHEAPASTRKEQP
jgi:hypothetical protein